MCIREKLPPNQQQASAVWLAPAGIICSLVKLLKYGIGLSHAVWGHEPHPLGIYHSGFGHLVTGMRTFIHGSCVNNWKCVMLQTQDLSNLVMVLHTISIGPTFMSEWCKCVKVRGTLKRHCPSRFKHYLQIQVTKYSMLPVLSDESKAYEIIASSSFSAAEWFSRQRNAKCFPVWYQKAAEIAKKCFEMLEEVPRNPFIAN